MDEIELVIKIPQEEYEMIVNSEDCGLHTLTRAIANGTPLPQGHRGLIDVQDAVDNLMEYKEIGIFGNYDKLTILGCIDRIENHVKPIIEADKENEDGSNN